MTTFVVLAHDEPEMLERLAVALAPHRVIVHVDAKCSLDVFPPLAHVHYLAERIDVRWGGYSVVEATVALYREALSGAESTEHIVLLSGHCYPIGGVDRFVRWLSTTNHQQHCQGAGLFDASGSDRQVLQRWLFDSLRPGPGVTYPLRGALRRGIAEYAPRRRRSSFRRRGLEPVAGSQWTALTAECVRDLLARLTPEVEKLFRRTLAPDETVFHTLLWNSPWRSELANPSWSWRDARPTEEFANFHYFPNMQRAYRKVDEFGHIVASKQFFTRKVTLRDGALLLNQLDACVLRAQEVSDG